MLQISDLYSAEHDPFKLMRLACCNLCADLREKRRILEEAIRHICCNLLPERATSRVWAKEPLTQLTQRYAVMVAQWHNMSGMLWEEDFVLQLIEKPEQYWAILKAYWHHFRLTQKLL